MCWKILHSHIISSVSMSFILNFFRFCTILIWYVLLITSFINFHGIYRFMNVLILWLTEILFFIISLRISGFLQKRLVTLRDTESFVSEVSGSYFKWFELLKWSDQFWLSGKTSDWTCFISEFFEISMQFQILNWW